MVMLIANAILSFCVYRFPRIYTKRISIHETFQTTVPREWCTSYNHTCICIFAVGKKRFRKHSSKVRSHEIEISSETSNGCHKFYKIHFVSIRQSEIFFYTNLRIIFYLRRNFFDQIFSK